jgi:alpha-1,3-rhamnosyl/mannosyltransferase
VTRVGVNLAWLVPGVVGGSEEATLGALRAVGDGGHDVDLVVFGTGALAAAHPDLAERFEYHHVDTGGGPGGGKVRRVATETFGLPRSVRAARVDVVHHAGGVVPFGRWGTTTVAIHDTQPLDLPGNFHPVKRGYLRAMIPLAVRRAALVTAPSEFVRRRLVDRVGADPDRVRVVPWSVPPYSPVADAAVAEVRERRALHRPFVLYPAIAYPHKDHATLLDAIAGTDADLVLTGAPGPCDADIARRAAAPDLAGRVHVLGRVAAGELRTLFAAAAVVAVPSRYEGFGLPALEALAAGRPTVVADAGSLPEVVGDAAIVVPPGDVEAWAAALTTALDDDTVRARLVEAGPLAAASWDPPRTAAALVAVWTDATSRSPGHP